MGKAATNLIIILGLITVVFAGYYLYSQRSSGSLSFDTGQVAMQSMLENSRLFIERRQALDKIALDITFFDDPNFTSLRSYSTPIITQPVGRTNPFARAEESVGTTTRPTQ